MSLFENQIKTLITTLENVPDPKSFDITNWHTRTPHVECGFAACICGHQALAPKSEFFDYQERPKDDSDKFTGDAVSISKNLDTACNILTGEFYLSISIYGGDEGGRRDAAIGTYLFSPSELAHPFLNSHTPSIEHTLSYLRLVLTKLGDFYD